MPIGISTPSLLASACLCGVLCRYDGAASAVPLLAKLLQNGHVLAVCPEVDGGLPVPRPPCELRNGRAVTRDGKDLTEQFLAGAGHTLQLALRHGIRFAVLKENSPSCGSSAIYDGSFSGIRIPGAGITASVLRKHGIQVISERDTFALTRWLSELRI